MADVWSTLAGVITGGLITTGTNWLLADRKSKADDKKEQRAHETERKRVARLIHGELTLIRAVLGMVVGHKEWSPEYEQQLSMVFWKQYAAYLAAELSEEAWGAVLRAYTSVDITMSEVRALAPRELTDEQVKGLMGDVEAINRAMASLLSLRTAIQGASALAG
jgi:hypothetical protein